MKGKRGKGARGNKGSNHFEKKVVEKGERGHSFLQDRYRNSAYDFGEKHHVCGDRKKIPGLKGRAGKRKQLKGKGKVVQYRVFS